MNVTFPYELHTKKSVNRSFLWHIGILQLASVSESQEDCGLRPLLWSWHLDRGLLYPKIIHLRDMADMTYPMKKYTTHFPKLYLMGKLWETFWDIWITTEWEYWAVCIFFGSFPPYQRWPRVTMMDGFFNTSEWDPKSWRMGFTWTFPQNHLVILRKWWSTRESRCTRVLD